MRRQNSRATTIIAALVWAITPTYAQTQVSGQVTGQVEDGTGAALQGATATLQGAAGRVVQTGADGRFAFQDLPEGNYILTAELDGFATVNRPFHLSVGQTLMFSLTLPVQLRETTTVTAARSGERDVQATPMAVSVLSGNDLQRIAARTVADVAGRAPSVTFSQNSDYSQLTIRGIGTNVVFAGSDPSSAVYLDGVYLARPVMVLADFLDLERVEVLRGPQGTLYGRNAVGGALNLITKVPTNELEATGSVVAGDLGTFRGEARLSGPLVRDRVMGSIAIKRGVSRGFVRDLDHPAHPLGSEDVAAARAGLRVVFNGSSDLLLSADVTDQDPTPLTYAKVLAVKPGFVIDNPADAHEVRTSTQAESHNLQHGVAARFTARLAPAITLTSLTAYRKLDYNVINDADITELDLTSVNLREIQHQISEEVTASEQRGNLTWIAGVFLFEERDRQPTAIQLRASGLENFLSPDVEANSQAVFGQATLRVTQPVSVTGGLRYTRERKTIDNVGRLATFETPFLLLPGSFAYRDSLADSAWTPKLGLDVQVTSRTLAYASATRGFKSGGFNFSSPEAGRGYAPEWAWTYEGGLKTTSVSGRVLLDAAVFRTDYRDLQVQTSIRPGVIDISNAAAATISGVELESAMQLSPAWHIGGHLAWLDATYDRYIAVGVGGVTGDVSGHQLNNAPEWSGSLWLEWTRRVRNARTLSLRADSRWQSTAFFTPFNDDIQKQRPYGQLDASADFGLTDWCNVGVYARNLANQDFITGTFSSPPPAIGGRPGYPRQLGVRLTVSR